MRITAPIVRRVHPAILFAAVAAAAYGLLIPQMGFYWDELPMSWIRYELGPAAMTRYFSTNRPVWGLLYQLTTRLLPQIPVYWEIFGLFWRWMATLLVWGIARSLWPDHRRLGVTMGLCFLLYPGFNQQWTSYLYSHFFIVLCFLLVSFLCMLWSVSHPRWYWGLTAAGMLFSALNLWMMEYFFVLELFRPFLILGMVVAMGSEAGVGPRLRRAMGLWAPYLLVWMSNVLWRLFVFNNQIYQPTLIPRLKAAPIAAGLELIGTILSNLYTVGLAAWLQIFHFPNPAADGFRIVLLYVAVVLVAALAAAGVLLAMRQDGESKRRIGLSAIGLGAAAMLMAGGPFWLTGLGVTLAYPANRFTLPFMLGASLFMGGLLELVSRRVRLGLVVGLIGLAAGRQTLWAESFRRDWATQKAMFWQMLWRAPGIAPHTIVLLNEGALPYYADNSLTGALNWIYDPDNRSGSMDYVLFYPTSRLSGTLQSLVPGQAISYDFIAEVFTGNTSQTAAFYYQPPGCLRLLDPTLDSVNRLIPDASLMRDAALLSSDSWIYSETTARMPALYNPEPTHGWCFYFERADLARQMGDWAKVAQLGDQAFALSDYPNDPVERFVFIEGYAHEGEWPKAIDLSNTSYKVSRAYVGPLLCRLWARIGAETVASEQKSASLDEVRSMFACAGA